LKQKAKVVGLGLSEIEILGSKRQATDSFNFLYLGRITTKKRIDIALDSFAKLTKITTRKIHFNICGSGDEKIIEAIKEKISNLSLNKCVSFLGWKTGNEKIEILRNSDCFILTSEDENFAIAVAESLQYGIPAIVSKQVALSRVVEDYGAGLVFKDLDSNEISKIMLEMIELDHEMLRESALRAGQQFSWEKISIIWSDSLQELLKKRA
jgi:glycosyltransferase involved in cell wall biosynthesis